jgi:hypothetical protein
LQNSPPAPASARIGNSQKFAFRDSRRVTQIGSSDTIYSESRVQNLQKSPPRTCSIRTGRQTLKTPPPAPNPLHQQQITLKAVCKICKTTPRPAGHRPPDNTQRYGNPLRF